MEKGRGKGTDTLHADEVFTRKEYIEREAAVMKIREWFWSAPGVHPKLDRDAAEEIMFSIPAADVVARDCYDRLLAENDELRKERPVRHGRWIEREDMYYGWNIWECSVCLEEFCVEEGTPKDNEYNYCPNCGALMDKDGDGDV